MTHTPGPWRWEVNRAHKSVKLCGGPPNQGFGKYDLTVLGFKRYGIQGAAPEFWDWNLEKLYGTPYRADALAVAVEGREHHAEWFADINHPDARLIAAAPELLEGAQDAVEAFKVLRVGMLDNKAAIEVIDAHIDELNYAIAKATQ